MLSPVSTKLINYSQHQQYLYFIPCINTTQILYDPVESIHTLFPASTELRSYPLYQQYSYPIPCINVTHTLFPV